MILVDFKLEFGRHHGEILLGDEICPDTCRFWDKATRKKLDKDRFRRDLGDVEEAYHEMLAPGVELSVRRGGNFARATCRGAELQVKVFVTPAQGNSRSAGARGRAIAQEPRFRRRRPRCGSAVTSCWTSTRRPSAEARETVREMCEQLLANPNIEDYRFEIDRLKAAAMKWGVVRFPGSLDDRDAL